ncbi:hemin-degrading factor [Mucilaginibacter lappiensis]|uniref:Putative hemin transport protein n=1 Tax=Mucilaginibacter lappiensis TaxID=354630 RepID=A0A841J5C7_9SPHI|nr:ChuX/HutX family heme-like substrate-binding protein [Mucilaginibacter lappiensis]MBB6125987.1 putative hemin transport protein [Mucilaginibacter lappiensis]
METLTNTLKTRYQEYKLANPKRRIREIADDLMVSEAELLATGLGETVTLLKKDFENILQQVNNLGYVMALTRNEYCVSERKGVYQNISFTPHAGLVLGEDIDLRLFLQQWHLGFAVKENGRESLQFFDKQGVAIHKIYLTDTSNKAAYDRLVLQFQDTDNHEIIVDTSEKPASAELPDTAIETVAFQDAWIAMKDSHEFFGLLRKFKLSRTQALRLAPAGYAKKVDLQSFQTIAETCSGQQIPVMIFVGNKGCIQIHSGNITKLVPMGPWFNVLDPEFNLHLREDFVAEVWHVIKPSTDGDVNSIELYDADGEMILQMFGKRKPGIPELTEWRELVNHTCK